MHSTNPIPLFSVLILLLFLSFPTTSLSLSDPRISIASLICGKTRPNNTVSFVHNFIINMESLSDQASTNQWGDHVTEPSSSSPVYGLTQCHSDLSRTDCLLCFAEARTRLPHCLPFSSARIFLDGCFLRYDNYSFFHDSVDDKHDTAKCGKNVVEDEMGRSQLGRNVEETIRKVMEMAVKSDDRFGAGVSGEGRDLSVYGLAQCWRSLSNEECKVCLEKAGREVRKCLPGKEGRGLNAGCFLRYSTEKFYGELRGKGSGGDEEGMCGYVALFFFGFFSLFGVLLVGGIGIGIWVVVG